MNSDLQKKALEIIKKKGFDENLTRNKDVQNLIEELNIYNIELQVQHDELLKTQQELQNSHDRYFNLYHSVPVGLLLLDEDGVITEVNKTAGEIFKTDPDNLIDKKLSSFIHPQYQDTFFLELRKLRNDITGNNCELHFIRRNGTDFFGRLHCIIKESNFGFYVHASLEDITRQKTDQDKLNKTLELSRKKEKEISALLEATHSVVNSNDFNIISGKIFTSCANLIGACAGYVVLLEEEGIENELVFIENGGKDCFADNDFLSMLHELHSEVFETGKVVYENQFRGSRFSGTIPARYSGLANILASPLVIDGKAAGIMGFTGKEGGFDDEDALLAKAFGDYAAIALKNSRTLDKLTTRAIELDQLNKTKNRIFSIIGHDLKNPLNSMIGFAEILAEDYQTASRERIGKFAQTILESSESLNHLLEQLMQWSYTQQEHLSPDFQSINVNSIVNECIGLLQLSAQRKSISIKNLIAGNCLVYADKESVTTVIRNLLGNAIKFTGKNGEIKISCRFDEKNQVVIMVSDNGIGMTREQVDALFSLEKNTSLKGTNGEKGTGLGLIICKELTQLNHGEIWVKSLPNKGSEFFLKLPGVK